MSAQVRRIAILVTSLDAAAGRQLLQAMPSGLARDVRRAMASLSSVDPAEQRQVLAEFRSQAIAAPGGTTAGSTAGATAATTATAELAAARGSTDPNQPTSLTNEAADEDHFHDAGDAARPWAQLDVAALTDLLSGERPLVIAVMLSQLHPRRAARLLEQFPRQQHRAVIAHLTSLGDIDPEAMQAIDDHLASRIVDYHHRREGQSESTGRMQELLAAASPELRTHWQQIIAESDQPLAKRLGIEVVARPAAALSAAAPHEEAARPSSRTAAEVTSASRHSLIDLLANNVVTTADTAYEAAGRAAPNSATSAMADNDGHPVVLPFPSPVPSQSAGRTRASDEPANAITTLDQILELPPRTIARVLSAVDGEVLLLALAGATPGFMQRFTTMLEKQDARALEARLGQLGAINLQDVDEAQKRLCDLASHIVGQLRFRRPAASPARVAA